ncbi:MAG: hypothetical protein BECKG1743D_GA0114223_105281, partial [Candidatus Kentron sp. G]
FLFFMYAFHAAISIRYWFAIAIAIDIRYRSSIRPRLFSIAIANRDIDSDPERITTPVAAWLRWVLRVFSSCSFVSFVDQDLFLLCASCAVMNPLRDETSNLFFQTVNFTLRASLLHQHILHDQIL